MKNLFGLQNKTVVITGASGGVGADSARLFSRIAGAKVALISRRGCDELVKEINAGSGTAKSYQADVSDRNELEEAFDRIVSDFGPVQSLLNVAGVCEFHAPDAGPLEKTVIDEERWERLVSVNGKGPALAIHFAARSMPEGGAIVNVGSTAGLYGGSMAVIDYTFAKAGLVGLTMGFAKILAVRGIRVNCVAPGPIEGTAMLSGANSEALKKIKSQIPLDRFCQTSDVANINLFLASRMSDVITGETINASAGQFISY